MTRAVIFQVAGTDLAVEAGADCEVVPGGPVTRLPQADPLLLGLTVLQGRAVPLVNLARLLRQTPTAGADFMVVTRWGPERLAFPADRVYGLATLPDRPGTSAVIGEPLALHAPAPLPPTVLPLNLGPLIDHLRAHLERA